MDADQRDVRSAAPPGWAGAVRCRLGTASAIFWIFSFYLGIDASIGFHQFFLRQIAGQPPARVFNRQSFFLAVDPFCFFLVVAWSCFLKSRRNDQQRRGLQQASCGMRWLFGPSEEGDSPVEQRRVDTGAALRQSGPWQGCDARR